MYERWENHELLDAHLSAPRMQKLVPQMLELIDSSFEDGIRLLLPFRPVPLEGALVGGPLPPREATSLTATPKVAGAPRVSPRRVAAPPHTRKRTMTTTLITGGNRGLGHEVARRLV
ncbi:putative quinol monooxygenase [Rhodococcus erythropolis]|uniref:putative quinol monooxygenase n=1 Tax=Rhodococcus erythropolis TaxID=1833 RepID=UPI002119B97D|nr:hypothetical protein [Rhodococcus erythropolis]